MELLREMRVFQRLVRRQTSELEDLRKEQVKERQAMQRAHCEAMDKLVITGEKFKRHLRGDRPAARSAQFVIIDY